MISIDIFDIEALLVPCSEEHPCGDDTREDTTPVSPYFTLKDLRNQARSLERQRLGDDDYQIPEQWAQLVTDIPPVLAERSKDLELTAWFIEALCRIHGFAGLTAGFELTRRLLETYWDQLHPMPDEDGISTRVAALAGLNGFDSDGTLIQPILCIPMFTDNGGNQFAEWHCEQAAEIARLNADKAEQKIKAGAVSNDQLTEAIRGTTDSELLAVYRQIEAAQTSYAAMAEVLDARCEEGQPTTRITQALQRCRDAFSFHGGERLKQALEKASTAPSENEIEDAAIEANEEATAVSPTTVKDPIAVARKSREEAVLQLRSLANFFRETEPHSPLSYLLEQAIRWSDLTLPELMQELIDDDNVRQGFFRLTGVPGQSTEG